MGEVCGTADTMITFGSTMPLKCMRQRKLIYWKALSSSEKLPIPRSTTCLCFCVLHWSI